MGNLAHELSADDVFITDELDRRRPKKSDYLQEKLALHDLAARMADEPAAVLPRFVDLAMEITGGISAGLSLYEPNPVPGVFRWRYLRGALAPFEDATTPRNFSPCGITLDRNAPVLSLHPERFYDWIADADIVVPEVLLVPLYIGGSEPLGTLWIVSDEEGHFDRSHARAMTELASFVDIALRMLRTEARLKEALDGQEMLALEMSHRVNNLFLVAMGMVHISERDAVGKDDLAKDLSGRLRALARAHSLVHPALKAVDGAPGTVDLATVIATVIEPYESANRSRFAVDGEPLPCAHHAASGIALIFHELATNAAKYGALAADGGQVTIAWRRDGDVLILRWIERGGPPIEAPPIEAPPSDQPSATHFGSTLIRHTIAQRFAGTLECAWPREGLVVTITLAFDRVVD